MVMTILLVLFGLAIAFGIGPLYRKTTQQPLPTWLGLAIRGFGAFLVVFALASTSFVFIEPDKTGHIQKIYGTSELTDGRIIARGDEKGFQAKIIQPGFNVSGFIRIINSVEELPIVNIPSGYYGRIETRDGKPLPQGAIMAAEWEDGKFQNMLDAEYFLDNGGEKGLQISVLKPGRYRINLYLYRISVGHYGQWKYIYNENGLHEFGPDRADLDTSITQIPAGHVGVVTSKVQKPGITDCVVESKAKDKDGKPIADALSVPLVKVGCRGIWETALTPGAYFLNHDAYQTTLVDTRVQAWVYRGGYESRSISLKVTQQGELEQTETSSSEPIPEGAADEAVDVKVEGWTVHQNLRAVVQVSPENAPIVVASVGGLDQVEDRILTPAIWSEVRDILGGTSLLPEFEMVPETLFDDRGHPVFDAAGNLKSTGRLSSTGKIKLDNEGKPTLRVRPVRILDLVENRDYLQRDVDRNVRAHGAKAGVTVMEVRFGNPDIPPEMLVARKREQLATQLKKAFEQEKLAQQARIETEAASATANQQTDLVKQQIANERAELRRDELKFLGEGEKARLIEVATGEEARANVLGKDRVLILNITNQVLQTLADNPQLVQLVGKLVPHTVVTGGDGLAGPMAILAGALKGQDKPE